MKIFRLMWFIWKHRGILLDYIQTASEYENQTTDVWREWCNAPEEKKEKLQQELDVLNSIAAGSSHCLGEALKIWGCRDIGRPAYHNAYPWED